MTYRGFLTSVVASAALLLTASSFAANLVHRYSFTANANDSVGGAHGTLVGGATIVSGAVQLNGSSAYVDLPNGLLTSRNSITIEVWTTDNGSGTWARIFDFGNSTNGENLPGNGTQYLFLTPQDGAGVLRGSITVSGSEQSLQHTGTRLPVGSLQHIVWTSDAASQVGRLYLNGVLVGENLAMTLRPSDMGNTLNNWLGRSQWIADPFYNGSITEFRIYDGALTPEEVLNSFNAGPEVPALYGPVQFVNLPVNQSAHELQSVEFSTTVAGTRPIGFQWRRNGVNIPGATNSTLVVVAALTNHNAAYSVVATNLNLGTPYSVTSGNAILTVTPDTTPPQLIRAASVFPNEVLVTFSEGVSDTTGTNVANYSITNNGGLLAISNARFGSSPAEIILTTGPQSFDTIYTLTANNIHDRSVAANLIAANSQTNFVATPFLGVAIGTALTNSVFSPVPGGFNLSSGGSGISGTNDQFTFGYQNYTNNFDVRVRVNSLAFASPWARAGLMARNGLTTNAQFAATFATPGPLGCFFGARFGFGSAVSMAGSFPVNYPDTWLRLRRTGNVFDGFASFDGTAWHYLGSSTIAMPSVIQVGFTLTAGDANAETTVQFRDFANASGPISTNAPLPFEPLGPSSRRTALVISEIMYNPPATWPGGDDLEFIEIWNSGLITEDLTGHKLSGEIDYSFPAGTKIAPGQFLVVAKNPVAAQNYYAVPCLGPYNQRLNNDGGELFLLNELGGRLLSIEYFNQAPWPVAPNGTGHSLVLARPSYGENDPRAWAASDIIGGSPGRFESFGLEPARSVVINEFLAHTDAPFVDYIELYNTGSQPVNLSGCWLSDTAEMNRYRIPDGTIIPARGLLSFTQLQIGFALSADGESIFLVNSNQTRVLDAVTFGGQENGVSTGRYPDGAPGFQRLSTVTPGTPNTPPRPSPVVINEIMYHPISEDDADEYAELYNRSGAPVDLSGWRLEDGISFTFPSNTIIAPGGYVVVAANVTNLIAKYPQLNATNTFGNFSGRLSNSGERIALSMPEDLVSTNGATVITNIFYITVNEVTYSDGGRWGEWSDGGGSSLELIDPNADTRLAPNWADSDESAKAPWTSIDVTAVMENGQTGIVNEGDSSQGTANRFELFLQGPGEALLDNVQFLSNGGANLLSNGDFSSGTSGWVLGGVLRKSFSEAGVGIGNSTALHLVSAGRGDTGPNKIYRSFAPATAAVGGTNTGTMRAQVRWLKGSPYILLRMRGNWMEVPRRLNVPNNLGTPGLVNSRRVANAGPAITDVSPNPILPAANQPVVVSARVSDPQNVNSVQLRYRIDPNLSYTTVNMVNDQGVYSATIPGQNNGTTVAFTITASDSLGATTQFPAAAPTRECLVRWGESVYGGSIGTYRLWLTAANISFWTGRERNANDTIDATFVYGNHRVVYNVDTMYSGSPFHTPAYNGPLNAIACDYEVNFPPDDRLLGSQPFVLTAYDVNDGNFFFNDDSAQVDITGNWIARKLGQQYNYRRHVRVVVNGLYRGTIYDDTQQPNGEMLDEYFPDDVNGQLRKIESWFEFANDGQTHGSVYATLTRVNKSDGEIDPKRYRWNWRPRATSNPENWTPFLNLVAAVNATSAPNYADLVRTWMDVPNFLRPIVTHHICGSWDSYAYQRGKNMFAYKPDNAGWRLQMWDIEIALGAGGNGPTDSIYNIFDQTLLTMLNTVPEFHREYLRGFKEAVDTALAPGVADQALDERYLAFQQHNIPLVSPQFIKSYLASRRSYLQSILPNPAFSISNPAFQNVSGSNVLSITGTAPLDVDRILVNGKAYPITWTSTAAWRVLVPLNNGSNPLVITATDRHGNIISNVGGTITANYTDASVAPEGHVVFNEIQFQPSEPGGAFVELFNTHSNFTFDLSGWKVDGLGYTFPAGATIGPRSYLVLAENPFVFGQLYGLTNVPFAQYGGTLNPNGEMLTLFRPDVGTNQIVVDRVRYEVTPPWPAPTAGVSLQLVDATQDNARVANWSTQQPITTVVTNTPQWVYVTQTGTLSVNATTFYLYLGAPGEIYLDDIKLVAGTIPENGANRITNGDFESTLTGPWNLSANFTGSARSSTVKHSGNFSLRLVATAAGSGTGNAISQTLSPALPAGSTYTLSYWYLQNSNGTPFVARLNNSSASAGLYSSFDPRLRVITTNVIASATPGRANNIATNLPPFPPLWLNELQADNVTGPFDNFGQRDPWAELINTGETNLDLAVYFLSDTYTNLTKWAFPGGSVASNGFTLVWCDNQPEQSTVAAPHANFVLPPDIGTLVLTRVINGTTQVVDYLNYRNLPANWSYGAVPDAQPFDRRNLFYATAGATNNGLAAPIEIYINEWLADNVATFADPADGNFEDWFELYNPGPTAVDLGGYYLTDDLNNPFKFQIPNNGHYVVPAGGYLLVWADNESNQNSLARADLHVDFALGKSGEALGLFAADGTMIDSVTFGPQITDVTQGRFPDGAATIFSMPTPTPGMPNIGPNQPPTLAPISNRVVTLGLTLNLTALGSDADAPAQSLSYSLVGAPFGMNIGSFDGVLTWTPTVAPATNTVSVVVTDNGTPSLSATQSFTVVTAPVPGVFSSLNAENELRLQWPTYAGQKFQVEMKDDLNAPTWIPITGELVGTGATMSITNVLDDTPQRFFRLRILP